MVDSVQYTNFAQNIKVMETTLRNIQKIQLQSFWNLIQTTDDGVQKELYAMLQRKYDKISNVEKSATPSFLKMKGILKGEGSESTDRLLLDEYLNDKYHS